MEANHLDAVMNVLYCITCIRRGNVQGKVRYFDWYIGQFSHISHLLENKVWTCLGTIHTKSTAAVFIHKLATNEAPNYDYKEKNVRAFIRRTVLLTNDRTFKIV